MLRRDPTYKRVRAGGRDITGRGTYWLADDHLLVVREEGFHERYRRFYLRDIHALVISHTRTGMVINIVLGAVAAFCVFGALTSTPFALISFLLVVAAIAALFLAINVLLGPTCECVMRTAVQTERLPGIGRLRGARKLSAALVKAAGELQRDIPVGAAPPPLPGAPVPVARPPSGFAPVPPLPIRHYHGRAHAIAFTLMLVDSALVLGYALLEYKAIEYLNMALTLVELGFIVAAIVKQQGTDMAAPVRRVLWTTVIYYALGMVAAFVLAIYIGISSGDEVDIENLRPSSHIALFTLYVVSSGYLLAAGLIGWSALIRFRRAQPGATSSASVPGSGKAVDSAPSPVKPSIPQQVPPLPPTDALN
ncbi:MAG: hypothetical protein FJ386_08250 [Verrucomicrobia bacterium]|nr:hypothetical protein [Verrucomicrobiota bacterium]